MRADQPLTVKMKGGSPTSVQTSVDLARVLLKARVLSRNLKRLGIITLESSPNGPFLALVVGGPETVLSFEESLEPPYYASKGESGEERPYMECFLHFDHHTEFGRQFVVPTVVGERAAFEFLETRQRPQCVRWQEV